MKSFVTEISNLVSSAQPCRTLLNPLTKHTEPKRFRGKILNPSKVLLKDTEPFKVCRSNYRTQRVPFEECRTIKYPLSKKFET